MEDQPRRTLGAARVDNLYRSQIVVAVIENDCIRGQPRQDFGARHPLERMVLIGIGPRIEDQPPFKRHTPHARRSQIPRFESRAYPEKSQ
jgi:hypothetical protein